jgi:hypothetical protein
MPQNFGPLTDYSLPDSIARMPRPYVQFEMRPKELQKDDGTKTFVDEVWAKVIAPGGKDVLEKPAADWIAGLAAKAEQGQVPPQWPREYRDALKSFREGEELAFDGTPIKSWSPLTPAQRKSILNANILTVEDLANANDEMRSRIGMGAAMLVEMARRFLEEAKGTGALATRLQAEIVKNEALTQRVATLTEQVAELLSRLPKEPAAAGAVTLKQK